MGTVNSVPKCCNQNHDKVFNQNFIIHNYFVFSGKTLLFLSFYIIQLRAIVTLSTYGKGNTGTVRPRDTRPQATRTLQVYVFELGPMSY